MTRWRTRRVGTASSLLSRRRGARAQPVGGVFRLGRLRCTAPTPTKFKVTENPDALRQRLAVGDRASFGLVIKPKVARVPGLSIRPSLGPRAGGVVQ